MQNRVTSHISTTQLLRILYSVLAIGAIGLLGVVQWLNVQTPVTLAASIAGSVVSIICLFLLNRDRQADSVTLLSVFLLVSIGAVAYQRGGLLVPVIAMFPVSVVVAGLYSRPIQALYFSASCALLIIFLWWAQELGWVASPEFEVPSALIMAFNLIAIVGIGIAVYINAQERERQATEAALATQELRFQNRELTASEARFKNLTNSLSDSVLIIHPTGYVVNVNLEACKTLGYTEADLTGVSYKTLFPEWDSEEILQRLEKVEYGEPILLYGTHQAKSGHEFPVETQASYIEFRDERCILAVARDITERQQTALDLHKARDEAEAANRAKSEFLANMSHEIRTPLNGILGVASILHDMEMTSQQQEYVDIIKRSGDSLLTVINDILDFSKIEANKLELEIQPFDLRKCIEDSLDLFSSTASKKGVDLAYKIAPEVPVSLIGDETRLRQILVNLVSNAIKFTDKGEVVVQAKGAEASDDRFNLQLSVTDTGIGMTPDEQDHLFKAFSQVDASMTRKYGGTGLGLAICKRLCELMGGRITVTSEKGAGTTFTFNVLAGVDHNAPPETWEIKDGALQGHTVLVVDDNFTNRIILTQFLQSWEINVRSAANGIEALHYIRQDSQIELAILDVQMPGMDGVALAREITKVRPELPMLVFSSVGYRDRQFDSMNVTGYLNKPLRPRELHRILLQTFTPQDVPNQPARPSATFDRELGERLKLSILIAEDNMVNQRVAVGVLKRFGFQADVVSNGLEVLNALKLRSYDVILMDIQMPEMDGLEATKRIMQMYEPHDRPYIVALTAHALQGYREQYLEIGMNDYISKPIVVKELRAALERAANDHTSQTLEQAPPPVVKRRPTDKSAYSQIDMSYLEDLFGEQAPVMLRELMPVFIEDATPDIVKMKAHAENEDWQGLRIAAHTLKGASASVGLMKLSELFLEVVTAAKSHTPFASHALLVEVDYAYAAVQREWEEIQQRDASAEP